MARLAFLAAALASGAILAGCNVVVTPAPLLTAADEAGAPALKPGLWRFDGDEKCQVDERRPLVEWPACAGGAVLSPGAAGYYERKSGTAVWSQQPLIVAAGAPRIAQTQVVISGDVKVEANPYSYAGVRPTSFDDRGRITAVVFWPVQCGPPPPAGGKAAMTTQLLPGLTMKADDPVCTTNSVEALRNAAKLSEAWAPKRLSARWLRDSDR